MAMLSPILQADAVVRGWLTVWHPWWLDVLMATLSVLATGGVLWLVIGGVQAIRRRLSLPRYWQLFLAVLAAWLVSDALVKPLVHRPRPFVAHPGLVRILGNPPAGTSVSFGAHAPRRSPPPGYWRRSSRRAARPSGHWRDSSPSPACTSGLTIRWT